jgi:hypothetical protein
VVTNSNNVGVTDRDREFVRRIGEAGPVNSAQVPNAPDDHAIREFRIDLMHAISHIVHTARRDNGVIPPHSTANHITILLTNRAYAANPLTPEHSYERCNATQDAMILAWFFDEEYAAWCALDSTHDRVLAVCSARLAAMVAMELGV